jgi:hypothetical protein
MVDALQILVAYVAQTVYPAMRAAMQSAVHVRHLEKTSCRGPTRKCRAREQKNGIRNDGEWTTSMLRKRATHWQEHLLQDESGRPWAQAQGANGQILGERPIEAISIFVIHKQAVAVVRIDAGEMGDDLRDVNICACALRHRTRRDSGGWSGGCEIYIRTSCRYSAGNLRHGAGGDACRLNAERALGVVPNELVRVVVKAPLAFGGAEIEGLGGILGEELRVRFVHFRTANVILGHASNIT